MATAAIERPQCRTEPSAYEALKKHFAEHPEERLNHPHKWDVSRSDIYAENTWHPIFREMREAGPLHYIPESPFGPYWAVVGHKAIQHIEALPDTFSSSWEHGGITILNRLTDEELAEAGIEVGSGAIRLLTMPRVLGFVFNPISLYYCHRADGRLAAMVYEVTSTFGERRSYVLPVPAAEVDDDRFRQQTDKRLYVSPFMGMEMDYVFRGRPPGETLSLAIDGRDAQGLLIATAMTGRRRPLTDRALVAAALSMPLLTLKVVAAIHWEALKLWLKRTPLTRKPAPEPGVLVL